LCLSCGQASPARAYNWKEHSQTDIEQRDAEIHELNEMLKASKETINHLEKEYRESENRRERLLLKVDVKNKAADKVFKQNDLTLSIMKYFHILGLFTDS
jgi:predicted RNase H-like nuclease (RuvC/YqgF family)